MNLAMPISSYAPHHVFLCDSVKNTVMDDSTFSRILYSGPLSTLVGIHLQLHVPGASDEHHYQKVRTVFDVAQNASLVKAIQSIETNILDMVDIGKRRVTKLSDQLRHGILRSAAHACWTSHGPDFVLKITGIWETDTEYGVTYKVTDITRR